MPPSILDTFNRADGAVGANWTGGVLDSSAGAFVVKTNQLGWTTGGGHMYFNSALTSGDQMAEVRVSALPNVWVGVSLGYLIGQNTGLIAYLDRGSGKVKLWRLEASVFTVNRETAYTLIAGDVLGVKVQNGRAMLTVNGVVILWDSMVNPLVPGYPGLYLEDANVRVDDFSAGTLLPSVDLSSAAVPTANATYQIQVGWAGGPFIIGHSTLEGGDQLGGAFSITTFENPYDDVSLDCGEFMIRRGRDDPLSPMNSGTCEFKLFDLDGLYNPVNEASPLIGVMTPMRPVRIRATFQGVTYPMFYGYIRSIDYDPEKYIATIRAEDLFLWFSRVNPEIVMVSEYTGAIIAEIIAATGFSQPSLIDVDPAKGDLVETFSMLGSVGARSALAGISDLLEAERGLFYISRAGAATYENRHRALTRASYAVLSVVANATPGISLDNLYNRVTVTKSGGVPQEAMDQGSVDAYSLSDLAFESAYFVDDEQALHLAGYLLFLYSTPTAPVWGIPFIANFDNATMVTALMSELGERVTVVSEAAGMASDYYIESITHRVKSAAKHEVEWALTKRAFPQGVEVFTIGTSTIAGPDILSYY